jgi:hypothetical protein
MPTPKQQRRRALELLEASIDGCTEAIMLAYGFKIELLVELVDAGLATASIERIVAGGRRVETRAEANGARTTTTCSPMASLSAASYAQPQRRSERHGCGRSPLGIMRIARRRTATRRRARQRWLRSSRAGGGE